MSPLVSVIMPVYNAEKYVADAVQSILDQSFRDFEFLIIDDGSSDRSLAILQKFAKRDARIRLITRPNTGYVAALNEMLSITRGQFTARMDADDVAMPDRLAEQCAFMRDHSRCAIVGSAVIFIDKHGRFLGVDPHLSDDAANQARALAGSTPIVHPSAMMRSSCLACVGPYDNELMYAEDLDLFLRLGEVGEIRNIQKPLLQYRIHDASVSAMFHDIQIARMKEACRRARRRRQLPEMQIEIAPWRPIGYREEAEHAVRWGWSSYNYGYWFTPLIYAVKAIRTNPRCLAGWKLLRTALLKPNCKIINR